MSGEKTRRDVLKTTAGTGAIIPGLTMTASAADSNEPDVEIIDRSEISESQAKSEFARTRSNSNVRSLTNKLRKEHDLIPAPESVSGFEIETDDEEINQDDPVVLFASFSSHGDSYALMVALVSTVENTRQPITAQMFVAEPAATDASTAESANSGTKISTFTAGPEGEVQSEVLEEEYQVQNREVGTQDVVGCATCVAVADWICDKGTGNVGRTRCIGQCMVFGPVGWAACSLTCALLLDLISDRGCTVGATAFCAKIDACS